MNFFPFTMPQAAGNGLFQLYVGQRRDLLEEKYGPNWSWYEVDVIVRGPTQVEFVTYKMASLAFGGRGGEQERMTLEVPAERLAPHIAQRQTIVAAQVYAHRMAERQRAKDDAGINAIFKELFGEKK